MSGWFKAIIFIQGPPEAVEMDLSKEGPDQTFDLLHEINWNFQNFCHRFFIFHPKMQILLGVQNAGNEGAAKILDFDLFS